MRDPPRPSQEIKRLNAISDTQPTRHHRRPRRHKGPTKPHNLMTLTMRSHYAWHYIVHHLYATNIARQINKWHPQYKIRVECRRVDDPHYPDLSCNVHDEKIQAIPTALQEEAWEYLFGGLTPQQIVHEINTKYLDPDYYFVLTTS
jgi:hypothetical protein